MATQYDIDMGLIAQIQFHSGWSRTKKNAEIRKIERRMYRMEQKELTANAKGKTTGYYTKHIGI